MRDAVDLHGRDLNRFLLVVEPRQSVEAVARGDDRRVRAPAKPPANMWDPLLEAAEIARRKASDTVIAVRMRLDDAGVGGPRPLDDLRTHFVPQRDVIRALVLERLGRHRPPLAQHEDAALG